MSRTERHRRGAARARSIALPLAALLVGCASLSPRPDDASPATVPVVVRPDAPVEYDVLVGEFAIRHGHFIEARDAFARAVQKDPGSANLHLKLARLHAQLEEADAALYHVRKAVELDPENVDARILLAQLLRVLRDLEAMEEVLIGENGKPLNTTASLMLYQAYMDTQRYPEALALAEVLVEDDAENANGYIAIAAIHERMGQLPEAEAALRRAVDYYPDKLPLYGRIARMYRTAGQREREIEIYREILDFEPTHYGTLVSLGEALVEVEAIDDAIATYERVVSQYPSDLQAVRRLASLYFVTERYDEAALLLASTIERVGDPEELLYTLGQVQRTAGQQTAALETFAQIPPGHPIYAEARLQMAGIYEDRGEFEAALGEVEIIRDLRPSRSLDFHTAGLLARAGRSEEGIALLDRMLEESPNDEDVLYQLGVLYGTTNRTDEALRYMRATLERNPDHPNALNFIGYTYAEQGERLDEAEALILKALELRPDDGYITDSLGWVYYMRARQAVSEDLGADASAYLEQARQQLILAAELTGGDPVISEHLGDVYRMMDEKRRALELYQQAIELEPRIEEQPDLMDKMQELREELGVK